MNIKKYFKVILILLFILYFIKALTVYNGQIIKNLNSGKLKQNKYTYTTGTCNLEIEPLQENRKIWAVNVITDAVITAGKSILQHVTVICFACFIIIIDLRMKIIKLINKYFNGSKYKDGALSY